MTKPEYDPCEYCGCLDQGTVWDEDLEAWLCDKHMNMVEDRTGYCPRDCQLGYGCDESC